MEKGFILSLIFAAIIAIFALNNSAKVLIDLFFVEIEMSQAIVILISAIFGAVVAAIFAGVRSIKSNREIKDLKNRVNELMGTNSELRNDIQSKDNRIKNLSKEILESSHKGIKGVDEDKIKVKSDIADDETDIQ